MKQAPPYPSGHKLLEGKTVLVTAAAGTGIGNAVARRCAVEGSKAMVIADIHERRLAEAAEGIERDTGLRPGTVVCDVTQRAQVVAAVQATAGLLDGGTLREAGNWLRLLVVYDLVVAAMALWVYPAVVEE